MFLDAAEQYSNNIKDFSVSHSTLSVSTLGGKWDGNDQAAGRGHSGRADERLILAGHQFAGAVQLLCITPFYWICFGFHPLPSFPFTY